MIKNYHHIALAIAAMFIPLHVNAGGVMLYEIGTDDVGLAAAGYSARAQDASTLFTNPAGLTRLSGNQVLVGAQVLYGDLELTASRVSPFLGNNNGGDPIGLFPGGSFFYSHTVNDFLKAGIGIYGNFGSSLSYDDDWVGRYSVISSTLLGISIQPTIALQLEHGLSVGAGVVAMNAFYRNKVGINNTVFEEETVPDGQLKLSDNTWGVGANLGVLYEANSCTRFGLTYQSPIKLDFSLPTQFSGIRPVLNGILLDTSLLNSNIDIGLEVPQSVMLSFFHQMTDQWALLMSTGWQNWKRFGQVDIGISTTEPRNLTVNEFFKDTWHIAVGLQHAYTQRFLINAGIGYDSAFQDKDRVQVSIPSNAALRLGLGSRYAYRDDLDFGVAIEYIAGGNLGINNHGLVKGDVVGDFDNAAVYFLSFNASWKCV